MRSNAAPKRGPGRPRKAPPAIPAPVPAPTVATVARQHALLVDEDVSMTIRVLIGNGDVSSFLRGLLRSMRLAQVKD